MHIGGFSTSGYLALKYAIQWPGAQGVLLFSPGEPAHGRHGQSADALTVRMMCEKSLNGDQAGYSGNRVTFTPASPGTQV